MCASALLTYRDSAAAPREECVGSMLLRRAAPATPKPDPALAALHWFVGSWRCKGQALPGPSSPGHATVADIRVQPDLGGFWLNVRYTERKTAANPHPAAGIVHWGYDGEQKKLVSGSVGNAGDYATQVSSGWQGDSLVWEGSVHTGTATLPGRDTFTRRGKNTAVHAGSLQVEGNWQKVDEETCSRVKG